VVSLLKLYPIETLYFPIKVSYFPSHLCISEQNYVFPMKNLYFQSKFCIFDQPFVFPIIPLYFRSQLCISRPSPASCVSRLSCPANKIWIRNMDYSYLDLYWHDTRTEVNEVRPAGRELADRNMHISAWCYHETDGQCVCVCCGGGLRPTVLPENWFVDSCSWTYVEWFWCSGDLAFYAFFLLCLPPWRWHHDWPKLVGVRLYNCC
jgi:hypothetical protein